LIPYSVPNNLKFLCVLFLNSAPSAVSKYMVNKKINIVTLGCSKNVVDSEKLLRQIKEGGFEVVHNSDDNSAGTVIINTCGFINDAKEESIDTILKFVRAAKRERLKTCMLWAVCRSVMPTL
jgi:hypothetical protein